MTQMTRMQALQAALLAEAEEKEKGKSGSNRKSSGGDNASYPFWEIPADKTATIRLLPDGDVNNPWFWKPREIIKLPFEGIVGGEYETEDKVEATVPCMDMFEKKACPIITATKSWWNDSAPPEKKALARIYYKKKSWLYQGFVVNSPLVEEEVPENPIRRFVINKSIHEIIYANMIAGEMEDLPVDYVGGRDFKIAKTIKGEYANYGTSSFSMKVRPLNENEMIALEQYKLFDLSTFLGPKPDADGVAMIKAMFDDSLAGKPFDFESYGQVYRAYKPGRRSGTDADAISNVSASSVPTARSEARSEPEDTGTKEESEAPVVTSSAKSAADTIAKLKARMNKG